MSLPPPPQQKEFNWIWQKWLHDLWKENEPGGGSSGDVTKVGTPVNNQVGIWTGDGTIEGSENLTFSTATLTVGSTSDRGEIHLDGDAGDSPVVEFNRNGASKARVQWNDGIDTLTIHNTVADGEIRLNIGGFSEFILEDVGLTLGAGIRLGEQADHGFTPSAAKGQLWVKSTATQQLIFTDDAGTDYNLLDSIGGSIADNQVAVGNGTDAIDGSSSLTWDGTTLGVTGAITCNAFTSNGIDDNATVETLQVADGQVAVGNNATEEAVILYVISDDLYHTYLRFGSDTDATAGQLDYFYNAGSPIFTIGTTVASGEFRLESGNGVIALTLNASQQTIVANRLGINRTPTYLFDAEEESGDAIGRIYASEDVIAADAVVRISSTHVDSSGYIQFGDKNDSNAGYLRYNHNTDALTIFTNTALALTLDSSQNATFAADVKADGYIQSNTATDTELNDIAHAINTNAGKIQGAMVYNTTQDKPVWAVGNADGSLWVDGAGTTANTPV